MPQADPMGLLLRGALSALSTVWPLFIILIAVALLKTKTVKGWSGEKITAAGMWTALDKNTYHRIDDVIIRTPTGTTQIDHIVLSKYGIFVIETKNIRGWIFGDQQSDKWTQSIYGKKSQFQNPLKQNYRHTKCITEYLDVDDRLLRPVVFFIGDCQFKTSMPANVLNKGLIPHIKDYTEIVMTEAEVADIEHRLLALKQDPSLTRKSHLESLRERHESTTVCPKCGGHLVERVSTKGSAAGTPFLGCSNFPRCRYLKKV